MSYNLNCSAHPDAGTFFNCISCKQEVELYGELEERKFCCVHGYNILAKKRICLIGYKYKKKDCVAIPYPSTIPKYISLDNNKFINNLSCIDLKKYNLHNFIEEVMNSYFIKEISGLILNYINPVSIISFIIYYLYLQNNSIINLDIILYIISNNIFSIEIENKNCYKLDINNNDYCISNNCVKNNICRSCENNIIKEFKNEYRKQSIIEECCHYDNSYIDDIYFIDVYMLHSYLESKKIINDNIVKILLDTK